MIESLDHVNLIVRDLGATKAFYAGVLGMQVGPVPGFTDGVERIWVYAANGHPVVHAADRLPIGDDMACWPDSLSGSGRVHHVAFRCAEYDAARARIAAAGIPMQFNEVPGIGLRQIFLTDPDGVLIELNFLGDS